MWVVFCVKCSYRVVGWVKITLTPLCKLVVMNRVCCEAQTWSRSQPLLTRPSAICNRLIQWMGSCYWVVGPGFDSQSEKLKTLKLADFLNWTYKIDRHMSWAIGEECKVTWLSILANKSKVFRSLFIGRSERLTIFVLPRIWYVTGWLDDCMGISQTLDEPRPDLPPQCGTSFLIYWPPPQSSGFFRGDCSA